MPSSSRHEEPPSPTPRDLPHVLGYVESLIPKDKMHHNFFIVKLISLHVGNKLRIERTRGNSFLGKKDEEQSSTIL